jgi:hypothetical protein
MSVSKQERDDYEHGISDEHLGWFDRAVNDVFVNHPDSREYYLGREGEQLDDHEDDDDE